MISVAGAAAIGLLAVACSSGSSTAGSSPAAAPSTSAASSPAASSATAAVSVRAITGIPGKALAGSHGRPLYLFEADKHGGSACTGACATAWPPVTVAGPPQAGSGVKQALLGTIKRSDGTMQVTYNGHPLYYFAGDTGTGTGPAQGQGSKAFGAGWYVVSASGNKIDTD